MNDRGDGDIDWRNPMLNIAGGHSMLHELSQLHVVAQSDKRGIVDARNGRSFGLSLYRAKVNQHNLLTSQNERSRCSTALSY
jgi:hypothetical protein